MIMYLVSYGDDEFFTDDPKKGREWLEAVACRPLPHVDDQFILLHMSGAIAGGMRAVPKLSYLVSRVDKNRAN